MQIESLWQLEVKLDGCTLVISAQCILNLNINLSADSNNTTISDTMTVSSPIFATSLLT